MRHRIAILAALLAVVTAAGSAADTGGLLVTCWPGYEVFLDGRPAGTTVVEQDGLYLEDVDAGLHVVRVERDGYVPWEAEIEVPAGGLVELKVGRLEPAAGAIRVVAEPGRRVYLDGRLVGLTTAENGGLEIVDLEAGEYELRVEKLGYEAVVRRVEVPAGGVAAVTVTGMDEVGAAPGASGDDAPAPAAVASVGAGAVEPPADMRESAAEAASADLPTIRRAPEAKADVLFGYRARGAAVEAGGTVTIHRERGGPRAPVMVFWCVGEAECVEQTSASYTPGSYRFRVNCRADGRDVDEFVELDAASGSTYLVDATFFAPGECSAKIVELGGGGE